MTLEELQIKFTASMSGLNSQLNSVKRQLGGVSSSANVASTAITKLASAAKLFVGIFVVRGLYKIGKASLEMANDVVESEQLFAVSMKGMADEARKWSDDLSDSLGLNAYSLRRNVGTFNTMFMSMGLGTQAAYDMSTSLVQLAEDMASFYNVDPEEMFTKLRAGITGETEPLKRLGIMVDEATTKQYALSEGISTTGKALTQTEKLMARYAAIMGQTANAQGDLARTIDSPVNQIRLLANTFDMVKISIGQAMQPIQAVVLPILNAVASAALSAANALKTFVWALTGFTGIGASAGAIAVAGADANKDLADSLNDSADAYKKAGGAAKKAAKDTKVGLKAFDEINKLAEEAAGTAGGGVGLDEKPEITENELLADSFESVSEAVSKAADWLKKVWEVAEPTRAALSRLWDTIKDFGVTVVWDSLVDFYEKFLKPIGKWTITEALPAFLDAVSAGVGTLKEMYKAAQPVWDSFYNNTLKPLGEWTGKAIIDALKWIKKAFDDISAWVKENPAAFSAISEGILAIVTAFLVLKGVVGTITLVQNGFKALAGVLAFFTSPTGIIALVIAGLILLATHWDEVKKWAIGAWESIEGVWKSVSDWFYNNVSYPLAVFMLNTWNSVWTWAVSAWETIKNAWIIASGWFYEKVLKPVAQFFGSVWNAIKGVVIGAWDGIKNAWIIASGWFYERVLKPVAQFFSSVWGTIKSTVVGVFESIKSAFSSIIETIKGWWNDFLSLFGKGASTNVNVNIHETTYKAVVETKKTATGKDVKYGGRGGSFGSVTTGYGNNIMGFASGGVFKPNRPFFGLLGDQTAGRNIEAPEGVLREIFREEMAMNAIKMPTSGTNMSALDVGGGYESNMIQKVTEALLGKLQIIMNVDGQTFGTASIRAINDAQRNAGRLLLEM